MWGAFLKAKEPPLVESHSQGTLSVLEKMARGSACSVTTVLLWTTSGMIEKLWENTENQSRAGGGPRRGSRRTDRLPRSAVCFPPPSALSTPLSAAVVSRLAHPVQRTRAGPTSTGRFLRPNHFPSGTPSCLGHRAQHLGEPSLWPCPQDAGQRRVHRRGRSTHPCSLWPGGPLGASHA